MRDRAAFRSDRLPTEDFNRRFAEDNLAFWTPILVEAARIGSGQRVLDVGCGTGGLTSAIAGTASARVTGLDCSPRFIRYARGSPDPARGSVEWLVGDAERLPFGDRSFERVLLSLVLHQLDEPSAAVAEAFRVLEDGGTVLVRTVTPEDVSHRVPQRYVPSLAAADAARLPALNTIVEWLTGAGFALVAVRRVLRNKRLRLADEERQLLIEVRHRYTFVASAELDEGLCSMRADAAAHEHDWVDPRPTCILVGEKASVTANG